MALFVRPSVGRSVGFSVCHNFSCFFHTLYQYVKLSIYPSINQSIYLSTYMSTYLPTYLLIYLNVPIDASSFPLLIVDIFLDVARDSEQINKKQYSSKYHAACVTERSDIWTYEFIREEVGYTNTAASKIRESYHQYNFLKNSGIMCFKGNIIMIYLLTH